MANGLSLEEVKYHLETTIPKLFEDMQDESKPVQERVEIYNLYVELLRILAHDNFIAYNMYLEIDDDHNSPNKAFFYHRKEVMYDLFESLNDMEVYNKYDYIFVSMPPRVGKTTTGIRFLAWIGGRKPEGSQLATSYSDNITSSFYIGVMEITEGHRHREVFPDAPIVLQNAKREEIWFKLKKRYASLTFVPIGGSMTGRCEASDYLYCDDLVSGYEEAISMPRLKKLDGLYRVNAKQRKKDGAKEIHVATMWSVHDPISQLVEEHKDNPRAKIIKLPCFKEDRTSRFDFFGGFSTEYYLDMEKSLDEASFSALYLCEPIEREGILYHTEELNYYFELPTEIEVDTRIAVCDSKNLGKDYVASPVAYVYGDIFYIHDVVYNNGLPEVTQPLVANKWLEHGVVMGDVEVNNGGNYYAEKVNDLIKQGGGKTSVRTFFSGNNKQTKIITYSDFVKKHFVFRHPSTYSPNSEYAQFMKALTSWTQTGKNTFDDAPDVTAMLAQMGQELSGRQVKIIDRRSIGI